MILKDNYDESKTVEDNFKTKSIDAYKTKFHAKIEENILDKEIEFLLEMINEIRALVFVLSYEHILLDDIKPDNTIIEDNNILLIDWDKWYQASLEVDYIITLNMFEINQLFRRLYRNACENSYERNAIDNLFDFSGVIENKPNTLNPALTLRNKIEGCKTVRDYIYKL